MEENKASYEQLEEENQRLKEELDNIEKSKKFQKKAAKWTLRKGVGVFLGKGLKAAIKQTFTEFNTNKKISTDTASNLGAHIIWRITRIGIFAIIFAILPISFLAIQTVYLGKQNDKIEKQNELITAQNNRLEQQTYLQEAGRRSSLVFLMNNVLDRMDDELKDTINNNDRELSDQLVGRIIALSKSLKPYKYLENDSLSMTLSPERGQLLINLTQAKLGKETYEKIFRNADFSHSELSNISFEYIDLSNVKLSNSILINVEFYHVNDLPKDMTNSILENVEFTECDFFNLNLSGSVISELILIGCSGYNIHLSGSIIDELSFEECMIESAQLNLSYINEFEVADSIIYDLAFYESILNRISFDDAYVDFFQLILNNGQLKKYHKKLHSEEESFTSLNKIDYPINPFKIDVDTLNNDFFGLYESEISINVIEEMEKIYRNPKYFKNIAILTDYNVKYQPNNSFIEVQKDSLYFTYHNIKSWVSRSFFLEQVRESFKNEILDYEKAESEGLKSVDGLNINYFRKLDDFCKRKKESSNRDYIRFNQLRGKTMYEAYKKSQQNNSKN